MEPLHINTRTDPNPKHLNRNPIQTLKWEKSNEIFLIMENVYAITSITSLISISCFIKTNELIYPFTEIYNFLTWKNISNLESTYLTTTGTKISEPTRSEWNPQFDLGKIELLNMIQDFKC